jgi:neopullulanase
MRKFLLFFFFVFYGFAGAQQATLDRIEPPFWWTGFRNSTLQLMVQGNNISSTHPSIIHSEIKILSVQKTENPDYLFITLDLSSAAPGTFEITFNKEKGNPVTTRYELRKRDPGSAERKGIDASDAIYLLMPDRFANGDTTNDNIPGMAEKKDREASEGRHGGDIKGIENHLDYLKDLGVTSLWITPLLENNQPVYSYHGYSTTDYYKVDPRFGTNDDYLRLSEEIHQQGMKLIMDMVFNHCGSEHWWMKDLPSSDWINTWPAFTRTSYRVGSITDPYVSKNDSIIFVKGWFDTTMPDLNQHNPFVKTYLIQNSIWWIEYAGIDGIRQDTYSYPFKDMMAEWDKAVLIEYPGFSIVGECWVNYPATLAYWQKNAVNKDGFNSMLPELFDFPLYDALQKSFNEAEGWNTGILRLYEILSQDFSYPDPFQLVTFADNHDVGRFFDTQNRDLRKMKMGMAFLLTTRGIPQIYYGTEILQSSGGEKGNGSYRRDFPGGWQGDKQNKFITEGRTPGENEMFDFVKKILNWRKSNEIVQTGKLRHFVPSEGIYTYFRYTNKGAVMVVMNNNETTKTLETSKFDEILKDYKSGRDVITGETISGLSKITVEAKSVLILELKP